VTGLRDIRRDDRIPRDTLDASTSFVIPRSTDRLRNILVDGDVEPPYALVGAGAPGFARELKREPGENPGLPRSGNRDTNSTQRTGPRRDWEAVDSRNPATAGTLVSPKTCRHLDAGDIRALFDLEASREAGRSELASRSAHAPSVRPVSRDGLQFRPRGR